MTVEQPPLRMLISGGSRGLGLAFCRYHVDRGRSVATFARSITPELAALAAGSEGRLTCFELDLSDDGAPRRAAERALKELGQIDVLVNNVAVAQDSLLAHLSDDELERIVTVNVSRTLQLTRQVVRAMILAGGGTILNVTSLTAARGYAGVSVYAASKGALEAFTRCAARELGGHGIVVNSIAPGFFASDLSAALSVANLERIRVRTPTGLLSDPEQIVRASEPLIAGHALNVTGQVVRVDGGVSA